MKPKGTQACDSFVLMQDLNPLSTLTKLQHLSLLDNPVTTQPNYRYVLHKLSTVSEAKVPLLEANLAQTCNCFVPAVYSEMVSVNQPSLHRQISSLHCTVAKQFTAWTY